MSLPVAYTKLAGWVASHRRYVFGVGLGGLVPLLAFSTVAGSYPWGSHPLARTAVLGSAWLIALHWPLVIAYFWFHPRWRSSTVTAWLAALALSAYLVGALLGPLLVFLSPHPSP